MDCCFQVHIAAVLADVPAAAGRAEPRLHLLLPLQPHDHGRGLRHHQAGRLRPSQRPPGIGGPREAVPLNNPAKREIQRG
jgi:hypothetical protein